MLRGISQPLSEWQTMRDPRLGESIDLSDSSNEAATHDPVLGVAAHALEERPGVTQPG